MKKNIKKVNHESDIKNFNKGTLLFDNKKSNCMKKVINFSSFLFILLFISNSLFAQFSLHIGAGVPTGDFAADDMDINKPNKVTCNVNNVGILLRDLSTITLIISFCDFDSLSRQILQCLSGEGLLFLSSQAIPFHSTNP